MYITEILDLVSYDMVLYGIAVMAAVIVLMGNWANGKEAGDGGYLLEVREGNSKG